MAEPARQLNEREGNTHDNHKPGQVFEPRIVEGNGGGDSIPRGKLVAAKEPTYDQPGNESSTPDKPNLKALEGGGEPSRPKDNLRSNAEDENSTSENLLKAESSAEVSPQRHENPVGDGYKSAGKQKGLMSRFTSRRALIGIGALGSATIVGAVLLFSFLNIFKLDGLMSNVTAKAFLRSSAVLDGRSSKWVSAYIQARMLDMGDSADMNNNENILFRSNKVDTNSPFTDWYKTLRASKFELEVFEKQGIKFTSAVTADGKIRPGRIDIKGQDSIPIKVSASDFSKISSGDIETINKYQTYVDTEVFKNDKAARKAIKQVVKENTLWHQIYQRRHLRKSIQNMTGVRDWRFFEQTRDKANESGAAVRAKVVDKMVPDATLLGRVTRCLFGVEQCNPSRDVADPKNRATVQAKYGTDKAKTKEEIKKEQEFLAQLKDKGIDPSDLSEALKKILTRANLITNLLFLPDTLDMIAFIDDNLEKLVKLVVLARGAQAAGLYQEFSTANDQLKTGQVTGEEVNHFMQILSSAGSSDGWAKVVEGKGDPGTASSTGKCSREELAKAEKQPNKYQKEYALLCADERIGSTAKAQQIQDEYKATVGIIVGPIADAWTGAKGNIITGTFIRAIQWFSGLIASALSGVFGAILDILGLKDNVEKAIFWVFGKLSAFIGINIISGNESGGKFYNWLVQGGAYTAESDARQKGASLTNGASLASTQLAIKQHQTDRQEDMSLFDRVASLDNPDSLAYKSLIAADSLRSNPSAAMASSLKNMWRGLGSSFSTILVGQSSAATLDGYAASKFAGIETYDYPPKCSTLNPILSKPIDGTNALDVFANPSKYNLKNAPIGLSQDEINSLNDWDVMTNSDEFYNTIYGIIGENTEDADDIAVQIYNCHLLDTAIRGSLGYLYGYSKDNGLEDNVASSPPPGTTPPPPGDPTSPVTGTAQQIAKQILAAAAAGKIKFNVLFGSDIFDGSTPEQNVEQTAAGLPAKTTSTCGSSGRGAQAPSPVVAMDLNLLKFILEVSQGQNIQINALAGQCHSSGSRHYEGKAVDFGCPFNASAADAVAGKYGVSRNSENCAQNAHYHYSVGGS
ncbi:hypothetical protein H0X09_00095 [Candidatus Saccharibacteria bacterium]|nr:hypothetical protein [Candidatus Saccharibacteria bacterium]